MASRRLLQLSCGAPAHSTGPVLADGSGKPRLLIVEDNADMLAYLTELLAPEYQITAAENGRKALEAVSTRLPDIVLSDVMMPEMDGMELVTRLKGDPELR